ncbi:MAG TPA: hypothetical protein VHZ09_09490 [Acidobacteriaceae bacterium]|nr:hypothetical protein [Acidobacteriaceae bacterium]
MPVIAPATAEARIIWKTSPHRKRELAMDEDVVDSGGGTGMQLSQSAIEAGWKGLAEGPPQQFWTATLRQDLPDLAFDGEGLWSFLFLPEVCGLVVVCYGLYGCFRLVSRLLDWAADLDWKSRTSPWVEPSLNLLDRGLAVTQGIHSRLSKMYRTAARLIKAHRAVTTVSVAKKEPPIRPASFPFPLFGVYSATGDGYFWSDEDEIE